MENCLLFLYGYSLTLMMKRDCGEQKSGYYGTATLNGRFSSLFECTLLICLPVHHQLGPTGPGPYQLFLSPVDALIGCKKLY